MNILDAIRDKRLFRPFLENRNGSIRSWKNWLIVLRLLFGLKVNEKRADIVKQLTGREISSFQKDGIGFSTALFLIGRRGGKSRIAATIGAYIACLSGKEDLLSPGEMGMVVIIAPTKKQGRIIKSYVRAIFDSALLEGEIVRETAESFGLSNGITIEIMIGDYRSIRGYTLLAAIVDEICFFGLDVESKVRNDQELITAIRPALATVQGRLISISSKYAKKGWAYRTWKKCFGNDESKTLVVDAPSKVMNPTLSQEIIDAAFQEDAASARSEFGGEWREDISQWLPPETILSCVIKGRQALIHRNRIQYFCFADVSGGRQEDSCLAIGHRDRNKGEDKVKSVLDAIYVYKSPNNPSECIDNMSLQIKKFGCSRVTGDNYAAEFVASAFRKNGVGYTKCSLPKSGLYLELIAHICSGSVELLDDETLISQLCLLERKTKSGGKDVVDHPARGRDDVANAVCGALVMMDFKVKHAGIFLPSENRLEEMRGARILSSI